MSPSCLPHLALGRGFLWFTAYPLLTACFCHLQACPCLCVSGLDKSTLHADHCDCGTVYPELVDSSDLTSCLL